MLSGAVAIAADAPLPRQPRRPLDVAEGRVARPRVEPAERQILGQLGLGDHIYGAGLEPRVLGFFDDVRAQRKVEQPGGALQHLRVANDNDPVLLPKSSPAKVLARISGPIPAGSPIVTAIRGGVMVVLLPALRERLNCPYSVSGPPKPPAFVTTGKGLGPIRVPTGRPSPPLHRAGSRTPQAAAPPRRQSRRRS